MLQVSVPGLELPGLGLLLSIVPLVAGAPWLLKTLCVAELARPHPCGSMMRSGLHLPVCDPAAPELWVEMWSVAGA